MTFYVNMALDLTNVDGNITSKAQYCKHLPRAHQPFAQSFNEVPLALGQVVLEAVDRFHDHPPLRESGHRAQRIQTCLELQGHPDAELRVILNAFSVFGTGRWASHRAAFFYFRLVIVGHSRGLSPRLKSNFSASYFFDRSGASSPSAVAKSMRCSCSWRRISRMSSAMAYSPSPSHCRTRSR